MIGGKSESQFSKTQSTANAYTKQSLESALKNAADNEFGKGWFARLWQTGKFKIIDSNEAKAFTNNAGVQAFYHNGTTYFVADGIASKTDLVGLLKHEIGVHALKMGKDDAGFKSILNQLESMRGKNAAVDEAFKAAERAGTSAADMAEEALGYFVEQNPKHKLTDRIFAWFKKMIAKLTGDYQFDPAELHKMAREALRKAPDELILDAVEPQGMFFEKVQQESIALGKNRNDAVKVNGSPNLWIIPKEVETRTKGAFPSKPIRLLMGKHFAPNRGYGLEHIVAEHEQQIKESGLTPEQWVTSIIQSARQVIDNGTDKLVIHSPSSPKGSIFIELRKSGDFYSVVTAYDGDKTNHGKVVWSGRNHTISSKGSEVSGTQGAFAATRESPINPSVHTEAVAKNESAQPRDALTVQTTSENIPQTPDDSIKFSKTQPSNDFELPEETPMQKQQRLWQDMNNRWKTAVDTIKAKGGKINEGNNVYDALERMPHIAAERITDFKRDTLNPLIERVARAKTNFDDIATLLYATHAPERNAEMQKINRQF